MKIYNAEGDKYPNDLEWGKEEYWKERIAEIFDRNNMKDIVNINEIDRVCIGNSSYPINRMYLKNGMILYDELNSPQWVLDENEKTLIMRAIFQGE